MTMAVVGAFVTAADVRVLHTRVKAAMDQVDSAVAACGRLDAATRAQWADELKAIKAYLVDDPSWLRAGEQMDQGEALLRELNAWGARIAAAACAAPPAADVSRPSASLGDLVAGAGDALKWIVIALVLVEISGRRR